MADVLAFQRPDPPQPDEPTVPHGAGTALCIDCRHEWEAAVPIGTEWFECPSCHTHKARWKFTFYPSDMVRQCNCGNQLFYMTPEGHLCANCGIYQRY